MRSMAVVNLQWYPPDRASAMATNCNEDLMQRRRRSEPRLLFRKLIARRSCARWYSKVDASTIGRFVIVRRIANVRYTCCYRNWCFVKKKKKRVWTPSAARLERIAPAILRSAPVIASKMSAEFTRQKFSSVTQAAWPGPDRHPTRNRQDHA